MEAIKKFLTDVGAGIMQIFGIKTLPFEVFNLGIVALAFALLIIVLIIIIISKSARKKKKQSVNATSADQNAPIEQVALTQQPEQKTEVVEQKPQPVKEDIQPVEKQVEEFIEPEVEPTAKTAEPKTESKKLLGKWIIEMRSEGEYDATLCASNGEIMLTSEIYTTEEGARKGIGSIIRGIENGKFVIYETKKGNFYYKLKTSTNRILCAGEIYKYKDQCLKAVESVKRLAFTANIESGVIQGRKYIEYVPQSLEDDAKALKGKWRIEKSENGYSAKLYANNGQLMLSTEDVSQEKSAKNSIESVKKNAESANFIIDTDKFGRFYYKLRNSQKTVICIGECYESLDSCVNAIESVRRFARSSSLVKEEN